ncbi:MAG: aspartyl/glutamyl-tRNA amidotransferase subunit C, partial [Myxococcales bacterium]
MSSSDDEMTAATVAQLGRLARLALPPDEQERLAGELRAILGHVRALQQI